MLSLICVDLDGVMVNWIGAVSELFGLDPQKVMQEWPEGVASFPEALGITSSALWKAIDKVGEPFWSNLKPLPWADELWALCEKTAPTIIMTSPSLSASCAAGKILWMQKRWGKGFRNFMIGSKKELLARPGVVLIDDYDKNIDAFTKAGGHGFLVSQPWNTNRTEFTVDQLEQFLMKHKYFDPQKRAEEKQAARDADQKAIESGEMTVEEVRKKNGMFTSVATLPIDHNKIKHPK